MKRLLKRTALLLVFALLLLSLFACAAPYENDARMGKYEALGPDGKTVAYALTLSPDGNGTITHYPTIGGETVEEIFFTVDGDTLTLHGTEAVGGVIGRNEFRGVFNLDDGTYSFDLCADQSGISLAVFVQVKG